MDPERFNVLMIIDSLGIGGAEVSLRTLTKAMVEKGHNVVVVVIKDDILLDLDERVSVEVLSYCRYKLAPTVLVNAIRLRRFIRELERKYGLFQLKVANLTLSHRLVNLARIDGVKYCIHENIYESNLAGRSGIKKYLRRLRLRKIYNSKDIIVVSDGVRKSLKEINGLRPRTIRTIYNAIDVDAIKKLSCEVNPYGGSRYIVHVGRLAIREKRHDVLLAAFKKMHSDYKLILVGDGPDRDRIEDLIHQMNLDEQVVLAGFHTNPYPVIRDSMLLVLSSDYEGFGVVLAEALSLETAVVSTNCKSGPGEIMSSALSGYLVETGDVDALAGKMRQAIDDVDEAAYPFDSADLSRFLPGNIVRQYTDMV
jgi:glycosyltransferase involved in cell wall biosynthesis